MTDSVPWTILGSTLLRAVRWDAGSRVLTVRFATGRVYDYSDVPASVVSELLDPDSTSPGRYFNEVIRDGFDYREITR